MRPGALPGERHRLSCGPIEDDRWHRAPGRKPITSGDNDQMSGHPTRVLITLLAALALLSACERKASSSAPPSPSSAAGGPSAPGAAGGGTAPSDPWAPSGAADPNHVPPKVIMEAAKDGIKFLHERAAETRTARDKQVAKLDQQIAKIQQLLEAGKYDEAEIRLVDIHWIPVEQGSHGDEDLIRQYDEKRAALTAFVNRKRGAQPPSR